MVYDLNNGVIDTDERWAAKEQNSHFFNTTSLGPAIIDDSNTNSRYFSGNDISAIGLIIGGTEYFGWISRPIKAGGVVRGFYFWTDDDFDDLATAQADGNQDGDSDIMDNKGFLLVVDQAWFNQQIAISDPYTINNVKDGNLTIQSPIDGTVVDINEQIDVGQWLNAGTPLMIIADKSRYMIEAYIAEDDIENIVVGTEAMFYPDNLDQPPVACRLVTIEDSSSASIPPLLASRHGGPIAVRVDNEDRTVPDIARYRLQLSVTGTKNAAFSSVQRGQLNITTKPSAILSSLWRQTMAFVIQQSGF